MENSVSFIPESVTMFLHTLLARNSECANPSERVRRLATSFGSDLVYAVTCEKTKPPKHILLLFAVKSITGNTELIQILNQLGQCLSYSQTRKSTQHYVHRSWNAQLMMCLLQETYIHVSLPPWLGTNNWLEETVSGEGTSTESMALLCKQNFWNLCLNKSSMQLLSPRRGASVLQHLNHPPTMLVSE